MFLPDAQSNEHVFVRIVESVRVTVKIASIAAFGFTVLFCPSKGFPSAFGVRGLFGYSFAITGERYGNDVSTTSSYLAPDSQGLAYMGEILFRRGQNLEVGLGLFNPFGYNDSGESFSYVSGAAVTNKATIKFRSIPVVTSIYIKHPLMKKVKGLLGMGLGYSFGGTLEETSSQLYDYGGGSFWTQDSRTAYKYLGGIAYRSTIGVEYEASPTISIFLAAALSLNTNVIKERKNTQSGVDNRSSPGYSFETNETITYQRDPVLSGPTSSTTTDNRVAGTGERIVISEGPGSYERSVYTYVNWTLTDIKTERKSTRKNFYRGSVPISVVTGITYYF